MGDSNSYLTYRQIEKRTSQLNEVGSDSCKIQTSYPMQDSNAISGYRRKISRLNKVKQGLSIMWAPFLKQNRHKCNFHKLVTCDVTVRLKKTITTSDLRPGDFSLSFIMQRLCNVAVTSQCFMGNFSGCNSFFMVTSNSTNKIIKFAENYEIS